ncbi:lipopolysaccharide heptosyltransferase family protein [Brevundimonas sp. S30B]|uniref:glycosyltransferase family 9 protein n=1 Tax=unclassified Brevundimonas TaxID=2622653 RepID=UPI001072B819|nr:MULTISPECIES: glycosyltransferase family 9 protein [unclassified Brevundimonas]QBX36812.1 lipopolysaccharide heptosyltransferase family protein [Brevundimonas sp. MF30-B]TFW04393.1 lipopolysaccharide heptosyltransferase family protein [Brevundimonas sp. S30B]
MNRILIIKLGAVGDIIMALPAIRRIRLAHPDAEITILTSRPFASLFEVCPDVDRVDSSARSGRKFESLWLARRVLEGGFSLVYDLQASAGTRRLFLALRLLTFGRKQRPRWSGPFRGASDPAPDLDRSAVRAQDRHAAQLDVPSLPTAGVDRQTPDLRWLADQSTFALPGSPYALLIPGASPGGAAKRWPEAGYAALAAALESRGLVPVVLGGSDDPELGRRVLAASRAGLDLVGKTSLFDIAALGASAEVAIGNDTGPTHLAASMGAPTLFLVSDASASALRAPFETITPLYAPRLDALSVDAVMEALGRILEEPSPP